MAISQAPTKGKGDGRVYPETKTEREAMLHKHLMGYISAIKELKREVNGLQEQVTDQMDEMYNFKRKILSLEKLLKLYLP